MMQTSEKKERKEMVMQTEFMLPLGGQPEVSMAVHLSCLCIVTRRSRERSRTSFG
jgi:hypothetical protein